VNSKIKLLSLKSFDIKGSWHIGDFFLKFFLYIQKHFKIISIIHVFDNICLQVAMATGQVLFQRFYYSKSFVRHPMETTAMGCVCLASKIEEAPRRIRDVINVFHHIKQVKNQK